MSVGKVCKVTSIVLFVLDFIGSIALGKELGGYDFSWVVFFCGIVAGFIFCLLIYAVGEIIDQLECSNNNTYELYNLMEKIVPKEEKNAEPPKLHLTSYFLKAEKTSDGGWVCKKCNTKNDSSVRFCKECETHK